MNELLELPNPEGLNLNYSEWRDGQVKAIAWFQEDDWLKSTLTPEGLRVFTSDPSSASIKVLEAPTGTGKTGLVLGLAALNPDLRFLILCATKVEQEQYQKNILDLENTNVASVSGKNNFHCYEKHPELRFEEGDTPEPCKSSDCWKTHVDEAPCEVGWICPQKKIGTCSYYYQRNMAGGAQVVVTNYAFGLSILNYTSPKRGIGKFDVIVEDEGHILDEQLESFISIKLSRRRVQQLFSVTLPDFESTTEWAAWAEDHQDTFSAAYDKYRGVNPQSLSKEESRELRAIERYTEDFEKLEAINYDWVVEPGKYGIDFQPVWITNDSWRVLFQYAPRHIIMSGTIPSASELGKKVGLKANEFKFFRLPYTFPPENRPIILRPRVDLSFKVRDLNLPTLVDAVDELLAEFPDIKSLIHTKSYAISTYLKKNSQFNQFMLTHDSNNRAAVLELFKVTDAPSILVSPSFEKAIDLPGEQCELVIIAKVPYPYLGSKVMKKRIKKSQTYYIHETLMAVIQMAGRGVRSDVDVCPTYILDAAGPKFFKQAKRLIPQGIQDAIRDD